MAQHRKSRCCCASERDLDGENRAGAKSRANVDLVPEQISKPLHDGKAETETLASLPCRIVKLMELFKDRLKFHLWDAGTGIPYLNAQPITRAAAAKEELAVGRVLHRIGQQIADDLLEQPRIAARR